MKFMKIYYVPLFNAHTYSLIDDSLKNPGELKDELRPHLFYYYDDAGNLVQQIEYFEGRELCTSINTYKQGKLIQTEKNFHETGGKIMTRILYSPTMIESISEMDGYPENRQVLKLDKDGKVIETIVYDAAGEIQSRQENDEYGNIIIAESVASCELYEYTYDDNGHILVRKTYDEDEKLVSEEKFTYLLGKLREITTWINGEPVEREEYGYGGDDNLKWVRTFNMDGDQLSEIEYNAKGEQIKHIRWENKTEIYTWEKQEFEELRAELYLETRVNTTRSHHRIPIGALISGKREVIIDENGRPLKELLINYTSRQSELNMVSERYYVYTYGEE